jgi:hypothetical protein
LSPALEQLLKLCACFQSFWNRNHLQRLPPHLPIPSNLWSYLLGSQRATHSDVRHLFQVEVPCRRVSTDIVNGEKNTITLTLENKSGKNVTLVSVGGAVYNVQNDALIKNVRCWPVTVGGGLSCIQLTTLTFSVGLVPSVKLQVPYIFYSE